MFWNPEVITTTGKSLRITQIQFNIIYLIRTAMRYGKKQTESHTESLTRTLSIINSINMPHQCMDDSRLASFVSIAAL
ncbi:Uncharacterised protein [Escherichia coli]|nr:Uncharacterised protein [Escherichia coli]